MTKLGSMVIVGFMILTLFFSCSRNSKPEKFGVYVVDNGEMTEVGTGIRVVRDADFHVLLYHNEIKPSQVFLISFGKRPSRGFQAIGMTEFDVFPVSSDANLYNLKPKSPLNSLGSKYFTIYVREPNDLTRSNIESLVPNIIIEQGNELQQRLAKIELTATLGMHKDAAQAAVDILHSTNDPDVLKKLARDAGLNIFHTSVIENDAWNSRMQTWHYAFEYIFSEDGKNIIESYWGIKIDPTGKECDQTLNELLMKGDRRAAMELSEEKEKAVERTSGRFALQDGILWRVSNGKPIEQLTSPILGEVTSFSLSPDSKKIVLTQNDRRIRILYMDKPISKDEVINEFEKYLKQ